MNPRISLFLTKNASIVCQVCRVIIYKYDLAFYPRITANALIPMAPGIKKPRRNGKINLLCSPCWRKENE